MLSFANNVDGKFKSKKSKLTTSPSASGTPPAINGLPYYMHGYKQEERSKGRHLLTGKEPVIMFIVG
ncbi:MAG: hypothetical protein JST10_03475 [Bacteroidetes bacterium]|nr:hypothetical protein [Bacteroidota bacterium]